MQALITESRDGVNRVKKIVEDLKEFSRLDRSDEWQSTDLQRCLDNTLGVALSGTAGKIEARKEFGSVPEVECLPQQLNQAFMNILINAVQAIKDRGTITLRTGIQDGEAWVEISDTGIGIPADILPRIFEPFFTTRPIGKGAGLGLSVAYALIQKHGGRIAVESTDGQGASFRIALPIKQPAQAGDTTRSPRLHAASVE